MGLSATNLPEKVGGARVVLRDARGGFVEAGAWKIPALSSALHVEMQAVLHAVRLASQLHGGVKNKMCFLFPSTEVVLLFRNLE